ncbi:MAG: NFACT RNA binding domain-containing protein [Balneolales bacterium]
MNNYYTLIYLTEELKKNLIGTIFLKALTSQKNRLDLYFEKYDNPFELSVSIEPGKTGMFLDRHSHPKARNTTYFFDTLKDTELISLNLADHDRYIYFNFDNDRQIIFQLFGHANVFLATNNQVVEAFKNSKNYNGNPVPKARKPVVKTSEEIKGSVRQKLISLNPTLPRNLLSDLIGYFQLNEKTDKELELLAHELHKVYMKDAIPGLLPDNRVCLLPDSFFPVDGKRVFENFNDCIRSAYYLSVHQEKFQNQITGFIKKIEKKLEKLEKRMTNLMKADKSLSQSEQYEKYGHLLMANSHISVPPDSEIIEIGDLYDDGNIISIPIKKGQNITTNAARYYDKSREARRAFENSKARLGETKKELTKTQNLLLELREIANLRELENWIKLNKNEELLTGGLKDIGQARHPYRKLNIENYDLWIGKNAKSNDDLLKESHKEDIWLHARGYTGSHVIIRMDKVLSYPPMEIIEKAASYAAKYSKGAGSSLTPVIYTKRKHVRKPKGALPGQVKVIKEQVVLAEPARDD